MKKILFILGFTVAVSTNILYAQTAATVNGIVITVKEANKALMILTNGKEKWDTLPDDGKKQLIQMMAPTKLVSVEAKKSLSKREKEAALAGFWMQKKISGTKVTDKEVKAAYNKMKKMAKKSKNKQKFPAFEVVKNQIKMQVAQEKVIATLMKKAKIKLK